MAVATAADFLALLRQFHLLEQAQLTEAAGLTQAFPEPRVFRVVAIVQNR